MSIRNQKGLAAIELTLILPFLLLIVFATAEFGRMLYQYNALNHLTRDALRYAVHDVVDGDTGIVTNDTISLISARSRNLLFYGQNSTDTEVLPGLSSATVSIVPHNSNFVTITVSYDWQPIFFDSMPSFVSTDSFDLTFPLVVNYTMRAL
ncbi:TadE/TadG family type IV pilus assembly protein [Thalassomonas sp. M1454]|uniref:TadE/TadG family type IV pilus assembly protein n=1 Tax=Thalassomonas sp. M1454 TaxID=2594477 RepID=UPI00117FFAB4|nr:TadE family protein [Thalassomonas sp. M1454]TRX54441.1 pilus assembly protein [Thalassomonas sp. M1454]